MARPNKPADDNRPRRYVDFTRIGLMRLLEEKERRDGGGLAKFPVGAIIDDLIFGRINSLPPCSAEAHGPAPVTPPVVPLVKKPVVKKRAPRRARANGAAAGEALSA